MHTAPAWLSYATAGIALLALFVASATYRRAGPRVRLGISLSTDVSSKSGQIVTFKLTNAGLAPVDVMRFRLVIDYLKAVALRSQTFEKGGMNGGDLQLPFRLQGGSEREWNYDIMEPFRQCIGSPESFKELRRESRALRLTLHEPPAFRIAFVAELGNGNPAELTLGHFKSRRLLNSVLDELEKS